MRRRAPVVVGVVLALVGLVAWGVVRRATSEAAGAKPKTVTLVHALRARYQPTKRYVATVEAWVRANLGPQLVSAYVETVAVRPGAMVKRGEVLATLDCKSAAAESRAIAMQSQALEKRQEAMQKESSRFSGLLDGGFVSPNEVDQKVAETASGEAQLLASKARLASAALEVNDCVLRAPFDGEVADRALDPGGFARPGHSVVSVVDRSSLRVSFEVPEEDFAYVDPGTSVGIRLVSVDRSLEAKIARRAPAADRSTRTVHCEIDLDDPNREIPVGTTAEITVKTGDPLDATELPIVAATVRGNRARLYEVVAGVAHQRTVGLLGERGTRFFLKPDLAEGALVVTEGRATLADNDRVEGAVHDEGVAPGGAAPANASAAPTALPAAARMPAKTPLGVEEHQ